MDLYFSLLPVHTGVRPVVVEGALRAHAALLTLLPTALRDGEGGATALAGRHAGAVLHGVGAGDRCRETERETVFSIRNSTEQEAAVWLFCTCVDLLF